LPLGKCGFERRERRAAARLGRRAGGAGTLDVPRLRVGIGRPARGDLSAYVLSPFADSEREEADEMVRRATATVELWMTRGIHAAMNETNRMDEKE